MPRQVQRISGSALTAATLTGLAPSDSPARLTMGRRKVPLLAQVPLFSGLSRRHLRRIADLAEEVRYRNGRTIVETGLPGNAFFVIAEGRAKVYRAKFPSGRPIAVLGPGDFFGEMALLDGGPRSATVVADGELTTIRLTRSGFRKVLTHEPSIAFGVMQELAARARRGTATE